MSHFFVNRKGDIVGPGGLLFPAADQDPPGNVRMTIDLLDRLYELGMAEERLKHSEGGRMMEAAKKRIAAAKADLIDDLGLDPDLLPKEG